MLWKYIFRNVGMRVRYTGSWVCEGELKVQFEDKIVVCLSAAKGNLDVKLCRGPIAEAPRRTR